MKDMLRSLMPPFVLKIRNAQRQKKEYENWQKSGYPSPAPQSVKQGIISSYGQKFGYTMLIETGTYLGDMVEAQKSNFKKIVSIELGVDLFERAVKRFKNDKNITILQGDSGKILPGLMATISEPAVFWLDGHYSAGITALGEKVCPIFEELNAILSSKRLNHVLLVDDARLFIGAEGYPSIPELTDFIKGKDSRYQLEVKHDIIRYVVPA